MLITTQLSVTKKWNIPVTIGGKINKLYMIYVIYMTEFHSSFEYEGNPTSFDQAGQLGDLCPVM